MKWCHHTVAPFFLRLRGKVKTFHLRSRFFELFQRDGKESAKTTRYTESSTRLCRNNG